MIVQELYAIQKRIGYLPRAELETLAERLNEPLYRIQEVVSFFPHYRRQPPPGCDVRVCRDMSCALRGSGAMIETLRSAFAKADGCAVTPVSCLGRCDRAPAVRIETNDGTGSSHPIHRTRTLLGRSAQEIVEQVRLAMGPPSRAASPAAPAAACAHDDLDADYACVDPSGWRINVYADRPVEARYESIRRFVEASRSDADYQAACEGVIRQLETAGLLGMGGAGGRTYKKWSEVLSAQGEHKFVVCNADESEPGTFKDRELLLRTPYLVLEGLILAGLLLRATRGFIYVRHEYEEQIEALRREIEWARDRGFCGENLLGTNRSFPVEVFVSPGGYICGEQTALVEAIEDRRAEPRNRPPELQTNGLWNMPTLLNNVETIAWVPSIMIRDGAWYASHGASGSYRGARFFSVSGDVSRPGVYEVPIGIRLGTLIDEYCGGVRRGERLKAVALSGPSGGFLPARLPRAALPSHVAATLPAGDSEFDIRNLELDLPSFRKWNMMLGAGIVVYGESADMLRQTVACQEFFRDESCGKCVPCRIGSRRLAEIGAALEAGELAAEDLRAIGTPGGAISELAQTMRQTAICGLGTVAANPLTSFLTHFPSETRRPQQH